MDVAFHERASVIVFDKTHPPGATQHDGRRGKKGNESKVSEGTVQYSSVQHSAAQFWQSTVQYRATQHIAIQSQ